jgi:hypothetical protein
MLLDAMVACGRGFSKLIRVAMKSKLFQFMGVPQEGQYDRSVSWPPPYCLSQTTDIVDLIPSTRNKREGLD